MAHLTIILYKYKRFTSFQYWNEIMISKIVCVMETGKEMLTTYLSDFLFLMTHVLGVNVTSAKHSTLHKHRLIVDWAETCRCLERVYMRGITWRLSFFIIIAAESFHPRWHTNSLAWHSCQQHNIRNWIVGLRTFTSGSKMIASSQSWSYLDENRVSSFWRLCKLA